MYAIPSFWITSVLCARVVIVAVLTAVNTLHVHHVADLVRARIIVITISIGGTAVWNPIVHTFTVYRIT